jgi:hypothetical protein
MRADELYRETISHEKAIDTAKIEGKEPPPFESGLDELIKSIPQIDASTDTLPIKAQAAESGPSMIESFRESVGDVLSYVFPAEKDEHKEFDKRLDAILAQKTKKLDSLAFEAEQRLRKKLADSIEANKKTSEEKGKADIFSSLFNTKTSTNSSSKTP